MVSPATHRVHGMGTALEVPTWPAITADEAAAILACFPSAGALEAVAWHSPRPFSAAGLVEAKRGTFLLKRHHRQVRSPTGLAEEHRLIAHLGARGVSVPEILIASDGTSAVAEGAWTYELQRRAPGLDLYRDRLSWTPFLTHRHAHAAGAALAHLHRAARDFTAPPRPPQPLVASFTIVPAHDPLAAAEAYVAARPALAGFLSARPWRRDLARLFAAFGDGLPERLAGEVSQWTHNDWHPSNLLWTEDGAVETVFDFGLSTRTCALHDLTTAIERTAFAWLRLDADGENMLTDPLAAKALLSGYHGVLPLRGDDLELIARVLPLVHVEFALSEIGYFHGIASDPGNAALAYDGYLIGHAEWFLSPPARAFLAEITRGVPR
jgi:Ser/Thr protein kinase RdoA (MazF antagonist)